MKFFKNLQRIWRQLFCSHLRFASIPPTSAQEKAAKTLDIHTGIICDRICIDCEFVQNKLQEAINHKQHTMLRAKEVVDRYVRKHRREGGEPGALALTSGTGEISLVEKGREALK